MHSVTKTIDFCYGHRLLNYEGQCKYLHGHNGKLEIDVESKSLDDKGMVIDFTVIKETVKTWIDSKMDHRMILSREDPLISVLEEAGQPIYVMEENPTAENIAKLVFNQVKSKGIDVKEIRLWETPTSYASYSEMS
ncbi:MAG: 6-carboxytetrahydropterin synthase QueD [Dehalococcoidia bacterium]|nr:6-carboxytetrahydropterin synthase QueD [Chloroflexota bacterium]|tara:strand:+ start:746 stop:1153 length:408 start_codon:yes stop_codon:yes gene_type:complete